MARFGRVRVYRRSPDDPRSAERMATVADPVGLVRGLFRCGAGGYNAGRGGFSR